MITFTPHESQWLIGFFLNFLLILSGQRIPLLTPKGWIHAGILGTILWGCLGWKGWLAVVSYLALGSIVTKVGFAYKEAIGIAEKRGGRRGPENVWGSAATGVVLAILIEIGWGSEDLLLIAFSASFAAKLGDTFGSEIGKRWGKRTFLITTFKPVPGGTEGAISVEGTIASLIGCISMAFILRSLSLIPNSLALSIVIISGFLATILESFLGALLQNKTSIISNELINFFQTTIAALISVYLAILIL